MFFFKDKSEEHILLRLNEQISRLNKLVKNLYEQQCIKAGINRKIVMGIREKGNNYASELDMQRDRILKIIHSQEDLVDSIGHCMDKIHNEFDLLIHMEQISLAIHNDNMRDDLSDMVDVHQMPLDKFRKEAEHVKMITSYFEILKVELEKQKEYIKQFNLDSNIVDEHYFYESEKYESKLSEDEIVSVSQLRDFSIDLNKMISKRLHSKIPFVTESDKAAYKIIAEFKKIKLGSGVFFRLNAHDFVRKLVRANIGSGHLRKLIVFLIFFLLSRMKKFKPSIYYSQIRASVMMYDLLSKQELNDNHKFEPRQACMITGATMMANIHELDFEKVTIKENQEFVDEMHIIKNYYQTVVQVFEEEFMFMNNLISEYRRTQKGDTSSLRWIIEGGKLIRLVYDFDAEIVLCGFDPATVSEKKLDIYKSLSKKHKGHKKAIDHLFERWDKLLLPDWRTM